MTTPSSSLRKSAERATLTLPFAVPAKEWFRLGECAELAGVSERYVEKKFDEGRQLSGHEHNGGTGARMTKRVPRVWFIAWMLSTARYDDESLGDALIASLSRLSRESLLRIAAAAHRQAHEKPLTRL